MRIADVSRSAKGRLDKVLVERGLVETRSKAQALIMARRVMVDGMIIDKAGAPVADDQEVSIRELEHPWVGRGGMKLARALEYFGVTVDGRVCADVGASTGGFTDVLLAKGASRVYAIDVGYGQLDQKLREDERVVVMERVNARYLEPEAFDPRPDLVSIDVSFISLELILPAVRGFLAEGGEVIPLIKPQFEVGRENVGRGGIVRDDELREMAIERVLRAASALGFTPAEVIESPIRGAEGNVEYLTLLRD